MDGDGGGLLVIVGMTGIAIVALVLEYLRRRDAPRQLAELQASWALIAKRLGASRPETLPSSGAVVFPDLIATVEGVEVRGSLSGWTAKRQKVSVLIEAQTRSGAHDLTLKKRSEPVQLRATSTRVEVRYGEIGVDPIHDKFAVKSDDPACIERWLTRDVRAALLATRSYSFEVRGARARATAVVDDLDSSDFVNAARALALLVVHRDDTPSVVETVARRLGGTLAERPNDESVSGFEDVITLPEGEVRLDRVRHLLGVHRTRELQWTRVRAESTSARPPFVALHADAPRDVAEVEGLSPTPIDALGATYRVESADRDATAARLDLPTCQRLLAALPTVLADDGAEVTAMTEGFDLDEDRLAATIQLVSKLARPSSGPYR